MFKWFLTILSLGAPDWLSIAVLCWRSWLTCFPDFILKKWSRSHSRSSGSRTNFILLIVSLTKWSNQLVLNSSYLLQLQKCPIWPSLTYPITTRSSQSIEIDIRNQSTSFVDYYRLISEIVEIKVVEKRYRLISILFILIRILDFQKGVCCIKQKEIIFKGFQQTLRRWTNMLYRSRNAFWVNTVIASVHVST